MKWNINESSVLAIRIGLDSMNEGESKEQEVWVLLLLLLLSMKGYENKRR